MEISTVYGVLNGCINPEYFEEGNLKNCRFNEENNILTEMGLLIPQYSDDIVRRKYNNSMSFYESGTVKSISLEKQTEIMTPIGEFPAELVTFYEDGSLKRVFPLNGKMSGYWSEKDEADLAFPMNFEFDFGAFTAKIMCVHFYQSGEIKSITLFPDEVITLRTPIGEIDIRTGFSLYESGSLKSVEPASPVSVNTPIGRLTAFDVSAVGIHGDSNSLTFTENGELSSLTFSNEEILVQNGNSPLVFIRPIIRQNPLSEDEFITIPVKVKFSNGIVTLSDTSDHSYGLKDTTFTVVQSKNAGSCTSCSSCSSCSACSGSC